MEESRGLTASELGSESQQNLESQYSRSKQECEMLMSRLQEAQDQLCSVQGKVQFQEALIQQQQTQILQLEGRPVPKSPAEQTATSVFLETSQLHGLRAELRRKTLQLDELERKLSTSQHNLDLMSVHRRSEGTLFLELEHYKADNERLVRLLKQTSEFRDFSEMAEAAGGVRFIPSSQNCAKKCHGEKPDKEMDDWVPSEAWRVAHDFLAKHGSSGFKAVHVNRLLEDMNKAWRKRETEVTKRTKAQCARDTQELRRKITNTPGYNQVRSEQEIHRLRGDLKKAQEDLRNFSSARTVPKPCGIENVMKIAADYQFENKALSLENAKLKGKLSLGDRPQNNPSFYKQKVLGQAEKLTHVLKNLKHSFHSKFGDSLDPAVLQRKQEWLLENIEQVVQDFTNTLPTL